MLPPVLRVQYKQDNILIDVSDKENKQEARVECQETPEHLGSLLLTWINFWFQHG